VAAAVVLVRLARRRAKVAARTGEQAERADACRVGAD
jgi:hypothetical protein